MAATPMSTRPQPLRAATAAFIGTTIEWYDFTSTPRPPRWCSARFFPAADPFVSTMVRHAAAGFRPLGGLIIRSSGRSRRPQEGPRRPWSSGSPRWASACCPAMRPRAFGPRRSCCCCAWPRAGVGGEWGGAVLMAGEHASQRRRIFAASFAQLAVRPDPVAAGLRLLTT